MACTTFTKINNFHVHSHSSTTLFISLLSMHRFCVFSWNLHIKIYHLHFSIISVAYFILFFFSFDDDSLFVHSFHCDIYMISYRVWFSAIRIKNYLTKNVNVIDNALVHDKLGENIYFISNDNYRLIWIGFQAEVEQNLWKSGWKWNYFVNVHTFDKRFL